MLFDLQTAIEKADNLPTFSMAGRKALAMLSEENVNLDELAMIIRSDQALTSKILRAVNSPAFGLYREIKLVDEALRYLGLVETKKLVFVATTHFLFGGTQDIETWRHAILTGYIAETLAEKIVPKINISDAYLIGLMHDIGKTFIEKVVPIVYRQVLPSLTEELGRLDAELSLFGIDHTEIGAQMLQFWNFDKHLCNAIAYHHSAVFAFSDPMGHLAWVANQVAHLADGRASDEAKITEKTFSFLNLKEISDLEKIRSESLKKVDDFQKKLEAIL